MIQRCTNPNNPRFADYGGRGIEICDRWRHSFANFLADMGQRPAGRSLGRVDNDGPYCAENCEWQTQAQQTRNRRNSFSGMTTAKVLEVRDLLAAGASVKTIAEAVGVERHVVGYVALTIEALQGDPSARV